MKNERSDLEAGFSLLEILIAALIASIGLIAVFSFFVMQDRIGRSQQKTAEVQQNSRIAAEFLTRDIRAAGFGLGPANAIRVEQNCADNPLTANADPCPNGSDRITANYRFTNTRLFGCTECSANVGQNFKVTQPNQICPGTREGSTNCGTSLHPTLFCGFTASPPVLVSFCAPEGSPCATLPVNSVDCGQGCGTGGGANNYCTDIKCAGAGCTTYQNVLDGIGRNGSPATNVIRVYQLLDLDGDGSTELVSSDTAAGPIGATAQYTILANNIDDFQVEVNSTVDAADFRTGDCSNPSTCWRSKDVYWASESKDANLQVTSADYPFNGVAYGGAVDVFNACRDTAVVNTVETANRANWGCSSRVRGVRFAIASRTAKRELDGGRTLLNVGYHPDLGNNVQSKPAFNPSATGCSVSGGATIAGFDAYLGCSGLGNEQGYRWRLITNEVLLRNVAGGLP